MRYLGRKYGYYPADCIETQYEIDTIMDTFNDYNFGLVKLFTSKTPKEKNAAIKAFFTDHTDAFFRAWDKRVEKNATGYMVGDSWTAADFTTLAITHTMYNHEHWHEMYAGRLDKYKSLSTYTKNRIKDFGGKLDERKPLPLNFMVQKKLEYEKIPEDKE
mmetsp:Transcript_39693/g.45577  ORF Transcript_39693/g.45577 Transcript_39693/m.45577 type:complete len:160 (-) Transcript_39693:33-512(-)